MKPIVNRRFRWPLGLGLLLSAAGCGDSWNSLNQMEKNVMNEVADTLAKVQDEASAKFAVEDATEKIKAKWKGVKDRKDKYLKSQFLNTLFDKIEQVKKADPSMDQEAILKVLTSGEQPLKKEGVEDFQKRLWLSSYEDHNRELAAINSRIDRELARISNLPEEAPPDTGGALPKGPNPMMSGSFVKNALKIPTEVFGKQ